MKGWLLITLLFMLAAWQGYAQEEEDDNGEDTCKEPRAVVEEDSVILAVTENGLIIRRKLGGRCAFDVPYGHCKQEQRKAKKAEMERGKMRDSTNDKANRTMDGDDGPGGDRPGRQGGPGGKMNGKNSGDNQEDGPGMSGRGGKVLGMRTANAKRCDKVGKRTVVNFKYIEGLDTNLNAASEKRFLKEFAPLSFTQEVDMPGSQSDEDPNVPIKASYVKALLVFPGKGSVDTNATAEAEVYIARGSGNLSIDEDEFRIKTGGIKFNFNISDSNNWLCGPQEQGAQCDSAIRVVFRMAGDNERVKARKERKCKNKQTNCGAVMELSDDASMSLTTQGEIDGQNKALSGTDGAVSIDDKGNINISCKFRRNCFIDPVVSASAEPDDSDDFKDDATDSSNSLAPSVLFPLVLILLALTLA